MQSRWLLAFSMLLVWGGLGACHKRPHAATLGIVTDLLGTTEPCGCNTQPLGGLDHLAGFIEQRQAERANTGPFAWALAGSTFFASETGNTAWLVQQRQQAQVVSEILQRLKPVAIVPGPLDRGILRADLEQLLSRSNLPLLWKGTGQSTFTLGGIKIGVLSMPPQRDVAFINAAARGLRQLGAQFIVAMTVTPQALQNTSVALEGVQVVVLSDANNRIPSLVQQGNVLIVHPGNKGEAIGLLQLLPQGDLNTWEYYDGGQANRQSLSAQLNRWQQEITQLPEGAAKAARQAKIVSLTEALARPIDAIPQGAYFTFHSEKITTATPTAAWAKQLLHSYNTQLCAATHSASDTQACPPAANPLERYAGSVGCLGCHQSTHASYLGSAHAHAWETLTKANKSCDVTCVGCHTVGFNEPGGFCHLADAPRYANVGCESCHGPGSGHIAHLDDASQWGKLRRKVPEAVCKKCHTPEHSEKFNYASYLPRILGPGHAARAN